MKPEIDLYRKPGKKLKFKTPSGKIELASSLLRKHGFDAVPQYTAHKEPPKGYFRLLFGRTPAHTFARTTNNRLLMQLYSENSVWVNKQAGLDMGLKDGEYVYLMNQDGQKTSNNVKVQLTQRIRPDAVWMVHGWGHTDSRLKAGYKKGAMDTEMLTNTVVDPIMGSIGTQNNFVTFIREA